VIVDEIFEFVAKRADAGAAVLLVDQFASRVLALASHAYVLRKGRVVFAGRASELLEQDLFDHYLGASDAPAR
jgi:branched-chain amino acid transport system ATP-binding protein